MSMAQSKHRLRYQSDARAQAARMAVWPCFNIRPVVSFVVLLTLLTAGLVTLSSKPALADTSLCSGNSYSSCTNVGHTDHGYSTHSGGSYWSMYSGHNCTNYVAYVESTVNGAPTPKYNLGNAADWATKASANGVQVNGTPVAGSVAQWNAAPWNNNNGHVAYVESVNSDGSITVSEDNYPTGPFDWKIISAGSSNWPNNFIHFRDPSNGSPPPTDTDGDGVPDSQDWCKITPGTTTNHGCPNNNIQISGDLNGDGKTDVIAISRSNSDNSPYIYWFQSTSTTGTPSVADPVLLEHLPAPAWNMNNLKWAVGDFNGDGKSDLFVASGDPSTGAVVMYVLLSTGTGLASPVLVKQPSLAWQWPLLTFMTGDVNGDGKADVIAISRDISDGSPYIYAFDSTSVGSTPSVADPVLLEHLPAPAWNMNNLKWAVGDFNGDGKSDLFVASGDPSTGAVVMYVLLSTGTGLASPVLVKQPSLAWQWPLLTFMTGDVNGDGKADVIAISRDISNGSPYIYAFDSTSVGSTPSVADPVLLEHLPAPAWNMNNLKWAVGDFNGDGKSDLFVASGDPSTGAVVMYVLLSTGTGLASPVLVKQPSLAWQWPLLTF